MSFAPPRAQELPFQTQRTPFAPETAPQLRTFLHPPTPRATHATSPPEPPGPETAFSGPKHVFRPTSGPKTAFSGPKNALRPTSGPRTAFSGPKNTFRPMNLPSTAKLSSPQPLKGNARYQSPRTPRPRNCLFGPKTCLSSLHGPRNCLFRPRERLSPSIGPRNCLFRPEES